MYPCPEREVPLSFQLALRKEKTRTEGRERVLRLEKKKKFRGKKVTDQFKLIREEPRKQVVDTVGKRPAWSGPSRRFCRRKKELP